MRIPIISPDQLALFTDFDGTLVPIAPTPDAVAVPAELPELMRSLEQQCGGALALITGRSLTNLASVFPFNHCAAAGSHGAEWRFPNSAPQAIANVDALFVPIKQPLTDFAQAHDLIMEDKQYSIALHFRQKPHLETELDALLEDLIDAESALKIMRGKAIREIKPKSINKGLAIERFMAQPPFAGRTPCYLGDDVTDEDGFAWVNSADGVSIKVGEGPTQARYQLESTAAVHTFFQQLVAGTQQ